MTTTAANLAGALNAYHGENEWEDVIYRLAGRQLDHAAINDADPSSGSHIVILTDGSGVEYADGAWSIRSNA